MSNKKRKETIPKTLKNKVWDTYVGRRYGIGPCYCCSKNIDSKDFECGHVQAESKGGKLLLTNLRPICGPCNRSMGNENMYKFMQRTGFYRWYWYHYFPSTLNLLYFIAIILLMFDFYFYQLTYTRQIGLEMKIASQKAICH